MANRQRWRGPRWERATREERLLLLEGIPSRYWKAMEKLPRFLPFEWIKPDGKAIKLTGARQRAAYLSMLKDTDLAVEAGLVIIGARDTDNQALHAAIDLARPFFGLREGSRLTAKMVDLGSVPDLDDTDNEGDNIGRPWWRAAEEACIRIYHNILPEGDMDRLELLRDMVVAASETTHIIVVAGQNPATFAVEHLRMDPDVLFYTDGRASKESR